MMPKTNLSLREILVRRSDWGRGICHTAAFSGVHHRRQVVDHRPLSNVQCWRYWHLADVQTALMNVRFEGNNGHDADVTRCLLMTLSGHPLGTQNELP